MQEDEQRTPLAAGCGHGINADTAVCVATARARVRAGAPPSKPRQLGSVEGPAKAGGACGGMRRTARDRITEGTIFRQV